SPGACTSTTKTRRCLSRRHDNLRGIGFRSCHGADRIGILSHGAREEQRTMSGPLTGRTIALAEGRQLEELAEVLEKEGATRLRCPMVSILDAPDPAPVLAWLRELIAGRFGYV